MLLGCVRDLPGVLRNVVQQADGQRLVGDLLMTANRLAASEGLVNKGYRFVINCGSDGGQTVDHLHLHLLGGRPLGWPPG